MVADPTTGRQRADADVIVVGAGPAGSTAATTSPAQAWTCCCSRSPPSRARRSAATASRRARIKQIIDLGIDCSEEAGWLHNRGLRVLGGGVSLELDWPTLASFPDFGAVRPRLDFDEMLARHAEKAGARLHEDTTVTDAVLDERTGRVVGVNGHVGRGKEARRSPSARRSSSPRRRVRPARAQPSASPSATTGRWASPSAATTAARGRRRLPRVLAGAVGPAERAQPELLPGYGWIFGMGDGTSNVGLGVLQHQPTAYGKTDYRALLRSWLDDTPEEWGYREENADGPVGGAALPMGFNRIPHYHPGPAARGRRRRDGQPVQRRGHRLRDGVGRHRLAVRDPVAARPRRRRGEGAGEYPTAVPAGARRLVPRRQPISQSDRQPHDHGPRDPARSAPPHADGVPARTAANLYDPKDGATSDRVITAMARLAPSV